jgi:hypothetical protein
MLVIVQIWDAQNQELARRVGATSRRIASKVAEVLHDGKTAKIVPKADATPSYADMCGATRDVCFGPEADIACHNRLIFLVGLFGYSPSHSIG